MKKSANNNNIFALADIGLVRRFLATITYVI